MRTRTSAVIRDIECDDTIHPPSYARRAGEGAPTTDVVQESENKLSHSQDKISFTPLRSAESLWGKLQLPIPLKLPLTVWVRMWCVLLVLLIITSMHSLILKNPYFVNNQEVSVLVNVSEHPFTQDALTTLSMPIAFDGGGSASGSTLQILTRRVKLSLTNAQLPGETIHTFRIENNVLTLISGRSPEPLTEFYSIVRCAIVAVADGGSKLRDAETCSFSSPGIASFFAGRECAVTTANSRKT